MSSLNIGLQLRHQQTQQCLPVESKVRQLEDLLDCNCDTNKLNRAFPSNSILINESKMRQLEDLLNCNCDTNKLYKACPSNWIENECVSLSIINVFLKYWIAIATPTNSAVPARRIQSETTWRSVGLQLRHQQTQPCLPVKFNINKWIQNETTWRSVELQLRHQQTLQSLPVELNRKWMCFLINYQCLP